LSENFAPSASIQNGGEQERDVSFAAAWRLHDLKIEKDAQDLWRKLKMIPESEIQQRLKQLCAAAYAKDEVVAIATAEPIFLSHLRFLHYRCAVSPSYRRHEMAWRLTAFAHDLLEQWSLANPQEKISGLLATMEAREFAGHLGAPILPKHGLNLVFIGYKPTGEQLRAMWFEHANVEERVRRADVEFSDAATAE
jgi:hypothetical protein